MVNGIPEKISMDCDAIAKLWLKRVRRSDGLKIYNALEDSELIAINRRIYQKLALWLRKELNTNGLGDFFVGIGSARRERGFAVSELIYALFLAQQAAQEYLTNETLADSSMTLYLMMDVSNHVADFFFLGSYYITKGFLEATYLDIQKNENIPEERLKDYLRDDFFFKSSSRL